MGLLNPRNLKMESSQMDMNGTLRKDLLEIICSGIHLRSETSHSFPGLDWDFYTASESSNRIPIKIEWKDVWILHFRYQSYVIEIFRRVQLLDVQSGFFLKRVFACP